MNKIDKYLVEKENNNQDLIGHINGVKGWLDDIKNMVEQGNIKTAKQTYKNLMKNLKLMEKLIK